MRKITVSRDVYTTTVTSREYTDPGPPIPYPIPRPSYNDEIVEANLLIQGKLLNNLVVEPKPEPTVEYASHPYAKSMDENYEQYANRVSDTIPNLSATDVVASAKTIHNLLRDLNRTVYHTSYCRPEDGIVSMKTRERKAIQDGLLPANWLIDTTYQSSFRSPKQISEVGVILKTESYKPTNKDEKLLKTIRKIFSFGKSTYRGEYCDVTDRYLGLGLYGPRRPSYLDPYTKNLP